MTKYRQKLPQLEGGLFLTDGGLETTLVFHDGLALPHFAAFDLLKDEQGRDLLRRYYERYIAIARRDGTGFVLESPTWRASPDWGERLGYSKEALAEANRRSIELIGELRRAHEMAGMPMVVSGCVGPRGDGYDPGRVPTAAEAEAYHAEQIGVFAEAGADMVAAITMTNVPEAVGITRAAKKAGMPVAISFTVETDGKLPTGDTLGQAIAAVDGETDRYPAYYMINCAHPTHFETTLEGGDWVRRVRGLRANASRRSHQELNDAPDLDDGDPAELGAQHGALLKRHRHINVLGGCCGTDHRHIDEISAACREAA
jgi:homocysteine S-methyltransferase